MSTAVTPFTGQNMLPSAAELQAMLQFADTLLKSGLLPTHIKTPQAAFTIIQKGKELGVPPLYALSNITVIQGKPTANAEMLQALVYRAHGDDALRFTETNDQRATLVYKRRGWAKPESFTFSIEDAKRAGLLSNATWQKYPQAMLRARCISAVARAAFADSIGGLYLPEELGASVSVTSEGEVVVDVEPEPVRPQRQTEPTPIRESAPQAQPTERELVARPRGIPATPPRQLTERNLDRDTGEIIEQAPPPQGQQPTVWQPARQGEPGMDDPATAQDRAKVSGFLRRLNDTTEIPESMTHGEAVVWISELVKVLNEQLAAAK